MYIISTIKWGFGNKLFMFLYLLNYSIINKAEKLYIVQAPSHHDRRTSEENFDKIFPKFKKLRFLEFISWKEYDIIKKGSIPYKEIDINDGNKWFTDTNLMQLQNVMNIYSYLTINPIYKNIITKYKININKGIAIHYRLGDKIQINLQKSKPMYVIMKPEYYIYHCQKMLLEKNGPVYVFSDSIDIAKKFLKDLPDNTIYLDIGYIETFYLLTKIKRLIISDSTLSIAAALLNKKAKQIVIPNYYIDVTTLKIKTHFLHDEYPNIIKENNQKYIMQKSDLLQIIKK
jgi:hypothetical protein